MSIKKEIDFINEIKRMAPHFKGLIQGIGDDAAAVELDAERLLLLCSDAVTEGVHFQSRKVSYRSIGYKAVSVAASDIAACGGEIKWFLADMVMPPGMNAAGRRNLFKGLLDGAKAAGARIVGGDSTSGKALTVSVTALGVCQKNCFVRRDGARPGDVIMVTGPVRNGKRDHMKFKVRQEESRELTGGYRINAMIDTSDGLAPDLLRICEASGTGCVIWSGGVPLSKDLSLDEALYYGESFELLFTLPEKESVRLVKGSARSRKPPRYFVIGRMTGDTRKRYVQYENKQVELRFDGYRHF